MTVSFNPRPLSALYGSLIGEASMYEAEQRMRDEIAKIIYGELLQVSMPAAEKCADKLIAYWRSTVPVRVAGPADARPERCEGPK